ncbi:MAG: hypothetical protein H5T42_04355 [Methanothrix sp.]|uniref:Uncharacterized protein n=1 Tax=Methanothrix thermoacetophila (strain DSM 6194 / JCM 14653 / NBRC 101360 / PT) TaxID=349307 RepID=A0B691_METTP|nr:MULTISPECIES: hypothetical protein [Methanothrix]ABK14215.1 hypothetical protein Mthe_0423 [Methanothrix thermoacetophila PT]MBC7079686.1 hypothetical protein [Methanothrix sp.]NPU87761.1 hypothetical protein [Methanothrix sp.]
MRRLLCLTALVFAITSSCGIDVSIYFSQEGTPREPLDVGKSLVYIVELSGAKNSMMYTVELTAGPDSSDTSISKSFTEKLNLNPGSTGILRFEVNFQSPDLRKGDFGRWLSDKNDTSIWDRTWYKATVTSLDPFEKPVVREDYTGHPTLVKVFEEFRDASVTPRKGTREDLYTYEVSVFSTAPDNITLEVAPSKNGPWTPVGTQDYTVPGSWKVLRWQNVSLDFDFTSAYYRFVGRKEKTFDGPFWPVSVEFRNESLSPERGLPDTPFRYALEVNASKEIEVSLNVWDVGSKSFVMVGRRTYRNVSSWERLEWDDVRVTATPEAYGSSQYYYGFHYVDAESPFATTKDMIGRYYAGPDVVVVWVKNTTVSPERGSAYTSYTYTAEIETTKPRCDLELQIRPPESDIWVSRGMVTYTGSNSTLVWRNVTFDEVNEDQLGMAAYRFVLDDNVLGEFPGPEFDASFRNVTYNRIGNTDRFNYKVSVRALRPIDVELLYTDDGINWINSGLIQNYSAPGNWTDLSWNNQPWHQTVKFDVKR